MPINTLPYPKNQPLLDGRRKITKDQYPEIRATYQELRSLQKTADFYNVSKRLIIFIIHPETLAKMQARDKRNQHYKRYYNKEKRKMYMRKYRAKKRKHNLMTWKTNIRKDKHAEPDY